MDAALNVQNLILMIEKTAKENGISVAKALRESGAGKDFVANLKKGQKPSIEKVAQLSFYFGVTVDYLLGKEDKKEKLPASNEEFMAMLREHNKGTAQVFFCGADGKVVELTPEEQAMLRGLLDLRKKKD